MKNSGLEWTRTKKILENKDRLGPGPKIIFSDRFGPIGGPWSFDFGISKTFLKNHSPTSSMSETKSCSDWLILNDSFQIDDEVDGKQNRISRERKLRKIEKITEKDLKEDF